jgi:hypothetical protein
MIGWNKNHRTTSPEVKRNQDICMRARHGRRALGRNLIAPHGCQRSLMLRACKADRQTSSRRVAWRRLMAGTEMVTQR